jgi:hypothetical protein
MLPRIMPVPSGRANPIFSSAMQVVGLRAPHAPGCGALSQLIPRLVDAKYGPVLRRVGDRQGLYEFVNPVLRLYINLRTF